MQKGVKGVLWAALISEDAQAANEADFGDAKDPTVSPVGEWAYKRQKVGQIWS